MTARFKAITTNIQIIYLQTPIYFEILLHVGQSKNRITKTATQVLNSKNITLLEF